MSRYMIKFNKEGYIKYISHLDLLRLFKRSFKRVDIKLQYSQGFNPHPKMSFAQPLSLGYESTCEYLEFDTIDTYPLETIVQRLNSIMPEGINIISCSELPQSGKTLAALTFSANYEITIPVDSSMNFNINDLVTGYMNQDSILVLKHQRKSGKDVEIDIKPMINSISGAFFDIVDDKHIMLTMDLAAGSVSNLSPEMVLSTFCQFAKIEYDRAEAGIKRTGIHFEI